MTKPRKRIKRKPSWERSCLGKLRYDTYEAAEIASRRPLAWIQKNGYLQPYQCKYCGGYHYGHPIRR